MTLTTLFVTNNIYCVIPEKKTYIMCKLIVISSTSWLQFLEHINSYLVTHI